MQEALVKWRAIVAVLEVMIERVKRSASPPELSRSPAVMRQALAELAEQQQRETAAFEVLWRSVAPSMIDALRAAVVADGITSLTLTYPHTGALIRVEAEGGVDSSRTCALLEEWVTDERVLVAVRRGLINDAVITPEGVRLSAGSQPA